MTDIERIEQRLSAVERTVVDGDHELDRLADVASLTEDIERIDARLDDLEHRVADIEATEAAIKGYVDEVDSVNEGVERRADAALDAVERLEARIDELERPPPGDGGNADGESTDADGESTDAGDDGHGPGRDRGPGAVTAADREAVDRVAAAAEDDTADDEGSSGYLPSLFSKLT